MRMSQVEEVGTFYQVKGFKYLQKVATKRRAMQFQFSRLCVENIFNNYSMSTRWIWDDRWRAELATIISNPTSASGINILIKAIKKYC